MRTRWMLMVGLGLAGCSGGGGGGTPAPDASPGSDGNASLDAGRSRDGAGSADASTVRDGQARDGGGGTVDGAGGQQDSGHPDGGSGHDAASDSGGDGSTGDTGSSTDGTTPTEAGQGDGDARADSGGHGDSATGDSGHGETGSSHDAGNACGFCNTPPAASCSNASTLEFYPSSGTCSAGVCTYTPGFTTCPNGCADATCSPSGWTTMNSSTIDALYAAWGSSASDVWAVGENGVAVHYDGHSWTVESPPTASYLASITGTGPDDVYTTDSSTNVWHFDGTGWKLVSTLAPEGTFSLGLFAASPGSLWIGGFQDPSDDFLNTAVLFPSNGTTLGTEQSDGAGENFNGPSNSCAVVALSPTDIWVGSSPLSHSDGTTLTQWSGQSGAVSFWAASAQKIFAGTGGNSVDIYDGMSWTLSNTGTSGQTGGIWGTSPSRVFVATWPGEGEGTVGEVRAFNGIGWSNETLPANTPGLYAVYAAPTGEVFAVGQGGTILKGP